MQFFTSQHVVMGTETRVEHYLSAVAALGAEPRQVRCSSRNGKGWVPAPDHDACPAQPSLSITCNSCCLGGHRHRPHRPCPASSAHRMPEPCCPHRQRHARAQPGMRLERMATCPESLQHHTLAVGNPALAKPMSVHVTSPGGAPASPRGALLVAATSGRPSKAQDWARQI